MILGNSNIRHGVSNGSIIIEPFREDQLKPNSYDLRLDKWYVRQKPVSHEIGLVVGKEGLWSDPRQSHGLIYLSPGETILAVTEEVFGTKYMPESGYQVVAQLKCRSTIARYGLSVCKCAGLGDVGYVGKWTLEISNHTLSPLSIPVGYRVAQVVFSYVEGCDIPYSGNYGSGYWDGFDPTDMIPKYWKDPEYTDDLGWKRKKG